MGNLVSRLCTSDWASESSKMWYEYEPLLTSSRLRSSTPSKDLKSTAPFYPRYYTNSHSSSVVYPSWDCYINGMTDYDYSYHAQGFKKGYNSPLFRLNQITSVPMLVKVRWTR